MLEQREHVADDGVDVDRAAVRPAAGRARFSRLLTILAARNVWRSIFSSSLVCGSSGSDRSSSICVKLEMPVSGVLTSCATPAASRPIAAIFSDICSCSSSWARSVMSSMITIVPATCRPSASRSGATATFTSSRAAARAARRERHPEERRAFGRSAGAARSISRTAPSNSSPTAADRVGARRRRAPRARGSSAERDRRDRRRPGRRRATRRRCR